MSEAEYNALRDACLAYLSANGTDVSAGMCAFILCAAVPCLFCPLLALHQKAKTITAQLDALAAKSAPRWAPGVGLRIELAQVSRPTARVPDAQAVDQFGQPLTTTDEDSGTQPVWPPLGLNLVVTTPTRELRSRWPPAGGFVLAPGAAPNPLLLAAGVPAPAAEPALVAFLGKHGLDGGDVAAVVRATGARTVADVALLTEADVAALPEGALTLVARKKLAAAAAAARA